ncbi:MAG: ADP-forming succinate--CoA ligase subunit beta [Firmicutes bacterium]|nr:ADP-forming succinate--CoA ligase subunit beta [Bacillota bacterium]
MKLYEFMGKEMFAKFGIPVPKGIVARTPAEAVAAVKEIGSCVMKSQVLTGKRGKAGGISFIDDFNQAAAEAEKLLQMEIGGYKVETLLVEEKLQIDQELYLSITVDRASKSPVLLASSQGGMDIEEVPEEFIVKKIIDVFIGVQPFIARDVCRRMGLTGSVAKSFTDILLKLYKMFCEMDAELVEINPLVISGDKVIAADAKVTIDDDSLFRHKDLPGVEERTALEKKAYDLGLAYVQLDGDIAVMANGAGMAMATLDTLNYYGGKPANFLDAGGGAGVEQTARALELLLETNPKVIMINIFGGITRCDDVASAFANVKKSKGITVPVVFRLVGTNEEAGRKILEEVGVHAYRTMQETAKKAAELSEQ